MAYLIFRTILVKLLEPIYFSLFLIMAKDIKHKRMLFTLIMVFEYLMLKCFIHYNVWFQLSYTFMTYINLKVFYKDKAQITDIFLFAFASLALIAISLISYFVVYFTIGIYDIALVLNRIMLFAFLFITKDIIRNTYKEFYSLWNRHGNPKKIKSLTLRNISIIIFNLMFYVINFCMIFLLKYLK